MAQAPTTDIGQPDLGWGVSWGQGLLADWWETTADLIFPQSMITYGRMRHDLQLKAVLQAYKLPIIRACWVVDPEGCRDEVVKHVADDLGIGVLGQDYKPGPARRRGIIWHRHLREALHMLTYGFMPFERRYEYDKNGAAHLVHLGQRMPWTVAAMNVGPDGIMRYMHQTTQRDPIPAERLVWYVMDQEGANWAGVSPMRAAFGAWLLKHETWRVHATSIRRFGMGIPEVTAPQGATQTQVQYARQLATSMRSGDQAGVGLPAGYEARIMGMTGSVPDALAFIQYLDRSMAKSALAGLIELGQTETGSRALGDTFFDLFQLSIQSVADEIATIATSGWEGMPGIVTDLVDQNWGEDEPAPRIVCTDVGENYQVTAEAIQALITCGAITPDPELDAWLRKTWRLPERSTAWEPSSRGIPAGTSIRPNVEQGYAQEAIQQENVPAPPPSQQRPALPAPKQQRALPGGKPQPNNRAYPAPAAAAPRRREGEARFEAAAHQQVWQHALDTLMADYRRVIDLQRNNLVDQVQAAAGNAKALLAPPVSDGPALIAAAMEWCAAQSAMQVIGEAAGQGVEINPARVRINAAKLARVAQARARVAASALAQAASGRALQVVAAAPDEQQPPPQGTPADEAAGAAAGAAAVGAVAAFLDGMSDKSQRDQLGAALTSAQNHGRIAAMRAAPVQATAAYVATEVLDGNTCGPCREEDGTEFPDLLAAEAAYPMGGYRDCEGFARCRGTIMAVWNPAPVQGAWDPAKHPRIPRGHHGGGEFISVGDIINFKGEHLEVKGLTLHPSRRHLPGQKGEKWLRVEPASRAGNVKRRGKWIPAADVKPATPAKLPQPGDIVRYKGEPLVVQGLTLHPERRHLPAGEPHVRIEPASRAGNVKRKGKWVPVREVKPVTPPPGAKPARLEPNVPTNLKKALPPREQKPSGRPLKDVLQEAIKNKPKPPGTPNVGPRGLGEHGGFVPPAPADFQRGDKVVFNQNPGEVLTVKKFTGDKHKAKVRFFNDPAHDKWIDVHQLDRRVKLQPGKDFGPKSAPLIGEQVHVPLFNGDAIVRQVDRKNGMVEVRRVNDMKLGWVDLNQIERPNRLDKLAVPKAPSAPKAPAFKRHDVAYLGGKKVIVREVRQNGRVRVRDQLPGGGVGPMPGTWVNSRDLTRNRPAGFKTPKPPSLKRGDVMRWNGMDVNVREVLPNGDVRVREGQGFGGIGHVVPRGELKSVPKPPPPPPVKVLMDTPDMKAMRTRYDTGIQSHKILGGGAQGDTQKLTLNDGSHVVKKRFPSPWGGFTPQQMADAEELAFYVGDAVGGTGVKPVIRLDRTTILMDFAENAKVGADWHGDGPQLFGSQQGLRIGLMDILNANTDRHAYNWMVTKDSRGVDVAIPIDNSSTFGIQGGGWPGNFRMALESQLKSGKQPFTKTEIQQMDARLTSPVLRDRFNARGQEQWYKDMLARWAKIKRDLGVPA